VIRFTKRVPASSKGGEGEGVDPLEALVPQQFEGEMEPFGGFALVVRVLGAEAEEGCAAWRGHPKNVRERNYGNSSTLVIVLDRHRNPEQRRLTLRKKAIEILGFQSQVRGKRAGPAFFGVDLRDLGCCEAPFALDDVEP
jgi:hypothetical protein